MPKLQPLIPRLQAELQKWTIQKLEFDNMYPHLPREILELERLSKTNLSKMKVLIAGGSGLLGKELSEKLSKI